MALRVLLADESSTIKKAIQMALSEYAVEVKSVQSGLDVLSVAHTFQPDIVLADVLLTKKNGYEVCAELKSDSGTRMIPVVLMWSSFLQIDRGQVTKVRADGTLEKPFDTKTLQSILEKLVPKLSKFPLKGLLTHPPLPDFTESDTFIRQKQTYGTLNLNLNLPEEKAQATVIEEMGLDDFNDDFRFQKTPLKMPPDDLSLPVLEPKDEWSAAPTDQFVIETENFGDFEEVTVVNAKANINSDLQQRIQEQVKHYVEDSPLAKSKTNESYSNQVKGLSQFDEQLLKEEIKQMAERICWQIIPDIVEKVAREELNKLLQGLEKNT